MLQDMEAGRAVEIDALVGSVFEPGRLTATPTPTINAIYQATKLLAYTIEPDMLSVRAVRDPGPQQPLVFFRRSGAGWLTTSVSVKIRENLGM